jgi:uncharacterized protein (UPF0332 family)
VNMKEKKRALGRAANKAFDLRQRGDYREQATLAREQVEPFIDWARRFINATRILHPIASNQYRVSLQPRLAHIVSMAL